ncbi:GNAT family N-acetyltransferase [Frigoribacterium sp. VKM Ac-2836]|uniref:GNAT family N-acetyltransferase n=1 Tax=Frigoribacterium sp. VKM Ac-2836 TaxID=2739014 RepID=UPI00156426BB|nr:GNAT family N-acetyltransferase [Frigoribacterium sp. VKM Ac-2836]NRD26662.1 GNAT family N-acetyltransferase [Frigoribacterium sp. VKM Ac-2836]
MPDDQPAETEPTAEPTATTSVAEAVTVGAPATWSPVVAPGEAAEDVSIGSADRPVSERVTASDVLTSPEPVAGVSWRPLTLDDLVPLHALCVRVGAVDHPDRGRSLEAVRDDLTAPGIDLVRDSTVAVDHEGRFVAWGLSHLGPTRVSMVWVDVNGGVDPARRGEGIGRRLLAWQCARGEQQLATCDERLPAGLGTDVEEDAAASRALFRRAVFDEARWWSELRRELAEPIHDVPLDRAVRLVTMTDEWVEPARHARNDAFRDHWGSQPTSEDRWGRMTGAGTFRRDLSMLAVARPLDDPAAAEQVVAFVLSDVDPADWAALGRRSVYVEYVGVRRSWRGRHLAQSLLASTLRAHAAEGLEVAVLDVDSASPTGALGLYEQAGFVAARRSTTVMRTY